MSDIYWEGKFRIAAIQECALLRKNPLTARYVRDNADNIRLYVKPFPAFGRTALRELTAGLVRDWMGWAADRGMTARTINKAICTMRTAARYAVSREDIEKDPFRAIKKAVESPKEKGIVTFAERTALLKSKPRDLLARLAVLLGLLCGMRRGEVRGLKWGDLDNGLIRLTHNFVEVDGLKKPKSGTLWAWGNNGAARSATAREPTAPFRPGLCRSARAL